MSRSPRSGCLPEGLYGSVHDRGRAGQPTAGSARRTPPAEDAARPCRGEVADHRRAWLCAAVAHRCRAAVRGLLAALRARLETIVTSNLPFEDWTQVLGSERLTGALLDRLTHHVSILTMNGDDPWPDGRGDPDGRLCRRWRQPLRSRHALSQLRLQQSRSRLRRLRRRALLPRRPALSRAAAERQRPHVSRSGRPVLCRRKGGTTGLIVGGVAGGVLGNIMARGGSEVLGTLLGAAGSALAGRAVDRNTSEARCRWASG